MESWKKNLGVAKWWTRGWTLQELIAPATVDFYDKDWKVLGIRRSLEDKIAFITGIDIRILRGDDPSSCSVAQRMSWAAYRVRTRAEDMAYCLLGLFNVNMPMLYGEGKRAFVRLQEEIMKVTEDYTLFAWSSEFDEAPSFALRSLLAQSPASFRLPAALEGKHLDFSNITSIFPLELGKKASGHCFQN
jgi:hypothetical protein